MAAAFYFRRLMRALTDIYHEADQRFTVSMTRPAIASHRPENRCTPLIQRIPRIQAEQSTARLFQNPVIQRQISCALHAMQIGDTRISQIHRPHFRTGHCSLGLNNTVILNTWYPRHFQATASLQDLRFASFALLS